MVGLVPARPGCYKTRLPHTLGTLEEKAYNANQQKAPNLMSGGTDIIRSKQRTWVAFGLRNTRIHIKNL